MSDKFVRGRATRRQTVVTLYNTCKLKRVPLLTYPEAVKVSIGRGPSWMHWVSNPGAIAVDVFVIVYQLGVCCVYIVFIGDNLKKLCDAYVNYTVEIYMLMILLPLIMLNMIPNLKLLAPLSGVANIMAALSIIFIAYFLLSGKKSNQPLDYWGTLPNFPLFFGTIVFALTSVGVVVAISTNMKTPKQFWVTCGVLDVGMIIIVLFFLSVGILGYMFCVSECSDAITLDLPKNNGLASAAVILYTISIFISYALNCYVPVDIIWRNYLGPALERRSVTKLRLCEYLLRIILCLFTFVLAVSIPRLGLFISLFGALCLSALGFCFPAIMEACMEFARPERLARKFIFAKDIFIFIVGLIGLTTGTYSAIEGIINSFR
ncbi:proton-coupled amino acid transporter-like protein CG1139 [Leptidea sinapis]|uniref:proton-coupled amino acid transporter-like protein CG1139 n=1 Tax=Leptidea sinapis TaxID=189913 RepID=UPI0021C338F3|nr:proton-coupled amino acid transporter-like protein CG1139 [Leptidea sinapis]